VSTCWDSTITAVPGHRRRISTAASRPSVVWVGGIRMSASTTPGRCAATRCSSRAASAPTPATSSPASVSTRRRPSRSSTASSAMTRRSRPADAHLGGARPGVLGHVGGGVSFTQGFTTTGNPTLALPLAGGRGFWMIGILTQTGHYASAAGLRAKTWPDGNQVASPRPAVVHHETDTFITTYTAIDPPRSAGATLTLDGFFGWPLSAVAG